MVFAGTRNLPDGSTQAVSFTLAPRRPLAQKTAMELIGEQLACRRAGRLVFSGLDFRVRAGEAARVLGPNGAGKSSLLRLLAGLAGRAGGDARIADASLSAEPEAFRDRLSYAGHLDASKPQMSLIENVAFWARIEGADPARAGEALERFGLARMSDSPAAICSAGQRRRLGLARLALSRRPLWLLDEPTTALDAASARGLEEMVAAHLAGGGIALIATHVPIALPPGPEIRPTRPADPSAGAGDAFLEGAWA